MLDQIVALANRLGRYGYRRNATQVYPELPNHQLPTVTAHIGHTFKHHHAQSDAEAAGRIMLAMMAVIKCHLHEH